MLANDKLGNQCENLQDPLPQTYLNAFEMIDADSNQELVVLEDTPGMIVGTFQLSFLQYLAYQDGIEHK